MLSSIIHLLSLTAVVIGTEFKSFLLPRQDVVVIPCSQQGLKDCGSGCIALTDTCCPNRAGGCPLGTFCDLGPNGEYGCCQIGKICTGNGGVVTSAGGTITIPGGTSTITIPGETSTETVDVPAESTPEPAETTEDETSTLTSTLTSTQTLESVSSISPTDTAMVLASNPVPSPSPPSSSIVATRTHNSTMTVPAATTLLPEFTGAADSRMQGITIGWLAIVLHFLAL